MSVSPVGQYPSPQDPSPQGKLIDKPMLAGFGVVIALAITMVIVLLTKAPEKPSEADLANQLETMLGSTPGLGDLAGDIAACTAPKLLDQMSPEGLEVLMETDMSQSSVGGSTLSTSDQDVFTDAVTDCATTAATDSYSGNDGS